MSATATLPLPPPPSQPSSRINLWRRIRETDHLTPFYVFPTYIDTGTTADRTLEAARQYKARYGSFPTEVQIHPAIDDGTRAVDLTVTFSKSPTLSKANQNMIYCLGPRPEKVAA